jgi:hypothetical protein
MTGAQSGIHETRREYRREWDRKHNGWQEKNCLKCGNHIPRTKSAGTICGKCPKSCLGCGADIWPKNPKLDVFCCIRCSVLSRKLKAMIGELRCT